MTECKNCGGAVLVDVLICNQCGYPIAIAKIVPWPKERWPITPSMFWKGTIRISLLLAFVALIGIFQRTLVNLSSLYFGYLLAFSLIAFLWAYLGSQAGRR